MIEIKERFVPKEKKVYLLLREERGEVCKFIKEQLRKGYIRCYKLKILKWVRKKYLVFR